MYLAIGLLVVGLGAFVYAWMAKQKELKASTALAQLSGEGRNTRVPAADYLKVANAYSSTTAGRQAQLLAAGALYVDGKYSEALAGFQSFIEKAGKSPLLPEAHLGVAASYEALGKLQEAAAKYQEIAG